MTAEEFHSALQEATNFPLRSFVLPYLKHTLPSLQRDLSNAARANNQVRQIFAFIIYYNWSIKLISKNAKNSHKVNRAIDTSFLPKYNILSSFFTVDFVVYRVFISKTSSCFYKISINIGDASCK